MGGSGGVTDLLSLQAKRRKEKSRKSRDRNSRGMEHILSRQGQGAFLVFYFFAFINQA
jgi:hypothetical protein